MRRANAVITLLIMILLVIHLIWGGLELFGMTNGGGSLFTAVSDILMLLICIHMIIGIKLTADTIISIRRSGVFYVRENMLFIIRRVSGFALMIFTMIHVIIFTGSRTSGGYRLKPFNAPALVSQILMVLALMLHIGTNITPLRIALGLSDKRNLRTDIALVIAIILILSGIAFLVYFLRWQRI